ncbi:DUF262 domain-containing protein [Cronobacter turicensis]|nr:DUF262 domain-containing protein [Cronobacter turicensis]ELY3626091.1 DUF262 domain-containing protein [Cronobacter turicensis]
MSLLDEINKGRKEIFTDAYPMSIGELVNMYRDGEIEINPEFQRFYRWSELQKVRLIESILLGIPLPSIFVSQREDGVWELVDGLQRTSTILSFMGELMDEHKQKMTPLKLKGTNYLPAMEGMTWTNDDKTLEIEDSIKRIFKREKIEVKIVKKESDSQTKYELFQRLNTGGSELSRQEVRNCLMIMLDRETYIMIDELSKFPPFVSCINLTERLFEERYDMELCLRSISLYKSIKRDIKIDYLKLTDMGDFLDEATTEITKLDIIEKSKLIKEFNDAFTLINKTLHENAFRKYSDGIYKGNFSIALFEAISISAFLLLDLLKANVLNDLEVEHKLITISQEIPGMDDFKKYSGSGVRASSRIPRILGLVMELCK